MRRAGGGLMRRLVVVDLPVMPPVRPMLARSVRGVPEPAAHGGLSFEPKWDGFRCLVFRDGDEVELTSRNTKPLTRYFPEVVAAVREQLPPRCVLDGELFVATDGRRLAFETLQERIHPAASRVALLSTTTPARFVAFDLLALGDDSFLDRPFAERRAGLTTALAGLGPDGPCHLTRTTTDRAQAQEWFERFEGAGLDGVVAKPLDAPYTENGRTMLKIKHERTADMVVAGYREHKTSTPEQPLVGSLLLGLYDDAGALQHVGVSASFTAARRAELVAELAPLVCPIEEHPWGRWAVANPGRVPGTQSPLERRQGPLLHPAATRAGRRGGLRPHGGHPPAPHRPPAPVAPRPRRRRRAATPSSRSPSGTTSPPSWAGRMMGTMTETHAPRPEEPADVDHDVPTAAAGPGGAHYDVVLLVEEQLSAADARQVRSLHVGVEEPVRYHVVLPVEDAAARVEAALGSLTSTDPLAPPTVPMGEVDSEAVAEGARARAAASLRSTREALEAAGGTLASARSSDADPVDALGAVIEEVGAREAIIVTRPHLVADFFHVDWASQARRHLGLPILHLVEHETFDAQAGGPEGPTGV